MSALVAVTLGDKKSSNDCYLAALAEGGLEPLPLLPGAGVETAREAVRRSSGLVLTGGADIHPSRYGQTPDGAAMKSVDVIRDDLEFAALAEADRLGIPVLAICRGMQLLNVHRGGALRQDIGDSHRDGRNQAEKWRSFHEVVLEPASALGRMLGKSISTNSRHHQAVDPARLGNDLRIVGRCPLDDAVEALEGPGGRFVVGVQWHPENMALGPIGSSERETGQRIFAAFSAAVGGER